MTMVTEVTTSLRCWRKGIEEESLYSRAEMPRKLRGNHG